MWHEILGLFKDWKPSPSQTVHIDGISDPDLFCMDKEEAKALQKFLYDSGYISHEFHEPIHALSYRLDEWIKQHDRPNN